ncbi:hypothetical protein CHUAL_005338 [Chamberlinius hualienensis]
MSNNKTDGLERIEAQNPFIPKTLWQILCESFYYKVSQEAFKIQWSCYKVKPTLKGQHASKGKAVKEKYLFAEVPEDSVSSILDNGIQCGNKPYSLLGDCKKGVLLSRCADVLDETRLEPNHKGVLIVFKVLLTSFREVDVSHHISNIIPSPGYSGHVPTDWRIFKKYQKKLYAEESLIDPFWLFYSAQYFLYELDNELRHVQPKDIFPLAVVSFCYELPLDFSTLPLGRSSKLCDIVLWKGQLTGSGIDCKLKVCLTSQELALNCIPIELQWSGQAAVQRIRSCNLILLPSSYVTKELELLKPTFCSKTQLHCFIVFNSSTSKYDRDCSLIAWRLTGSTENVVKSSGLRDYFAANFRKTDTTVVENVEANGKDPKYVSNNLKKSFQSNVKNKVTNSVANSRLPSSANSLNNSGDTLNEVRSEMVNVNDMSVFTRTHESDEHVGNFETTTSRSEVLPLTTGSLSKENMLPNVIDDVDRSRLSSNGREVNVSSNFSEDIAEHIESTSALNEKSTTSHEIDHDFICKVEVTDEFDDDQRSKSELEMVNNLSVESNGVLEHGADESDDVVTNENATTMLNDDTEFLACYSPPIGDDVCIIDFTLPARTAYKPEAVQTKYFINGKICRFNSRSEDALHVIESNILVGNAQDDRKRSTSSSCDTELSSIKSRKNSRSKRRLPRKSSVSTAPASSLESHLTTSSSGAAVASNSTWFCRNCVIYALFI